MTVGRTPALHRKTHLYKKLLVSLHLQRIYRLGQRHEFGIEPVFAGTLETSGTFALA